MTLTIGLMLAGGLAALVLGGEFLVRGAVAIARRAKVSPLLIGLTLVGFGTSTPELVTSIEAALIGSPGVAVGNVVGSNICNILLILGLAALIRPVTATPSAFSRDGTALALSAGLCLAAVLYGEIGRVVGGVFVAGLIGYIGVTYWAESRRRSPASDMLDAEAASLTPIKGGWIGAALGVVAGLALTIVGAKLLVGGAIDLARAFGVSETIIGLSVVAIGTSLPELATSLVAATRGQSDVAFGNIVGSNIYNVLAILGLTALTEPLSVPLEIVRVDIWVMLAATAALIAAVFTGWRVSRLEGGVMLAGYAAYLGYLGATSVGAAG